MNVGSYNFHEQIEARFNRFIKPQFEISNNVSKEALFIRLLLGTVSFTNTFSGVQTIQSKNYSILGVTTNPIITTKIIRECFEPDIKLQLICDYLDNNKFINNVFFENLLMELTCYFQKKQENSFTIAFLHLYRSIEFISYSFPLIYASISRNYYESFERMKNYFSGAKNELAFFETFLSNLLAGLNFLESQFTINFNCLEPQLNRNHYQVMKRILTVDRIISYVENSSLTVEYKHLIFLAINLRNRYFHFSINDKRNIRTTEIYETDLFFKTINEEIINWISVIYFEILKASINKTI